MHVLENDELQLMNPTEEI